MSTTTSTPSPSLSRHLSYRHERPAEPSSSSSPSLRSKRWSIHALDQIYSPPPGPTTTTSPTTPGPAAAASTPARRQHLRTTSCYLADQPPLRRITSTSSIVQHEPSPASIPLSGSARVPRTPAFERAYAFFEQRAAWESERDQERERAEVDAAAHEPVISRRPSSIRAAQVVEQQYTQRATPPPPASASSASARRRDFLTWNMDPEYVPEVRTAPPERGSYSERERHHPHPHGDLHNSPSPNKTSRSIAHARSWTRTPRKGEAASAQQSRSPRKERLYRDRDSERAAPSSFMEKLRIHDECAPPRRSPAVSTRCTSAALDASTLDASFSAAASIGDRTYDALEVAVETNRERRKSLGFALRPPPSVQRPSSPSSAGSSSLSVSTPPSSNSGSSPVVPLTKRRASSQHLVAKLEAARGAAAAAVVAAQDDRDRFLSTGPSGRTPARRSPLRHQASTNFVEDLRHQKSSIFAPDATASGLLDSESFQLTPPSTVRNPPPSAYTPSATRTAVATTTFTPSSLSRHRPVSSRGDATAAPPRTPNHHAADVTLDIATLLRSARPRATGAEESFLAPGAGFHLADLSDAEDGEGDDTIVEDIPVIHSSIRSQSTASGTMSKSATLASLDHRSLPALAPALAAAEGRMPRSDSTRTITRSDSVRTLQRSDSTRTLQRSDSTRAFGRVGSSRVPGSMSSRALPSSGSTRFMSSLAREGPHGVGATPRRITSDRERERSDVPMSMRRPMTRSSTAAAAAAAAPSQPPPSTDDRWADAVERFPPPLLTPAPERRLPSSVSSRRISTLSTPALGMQRSGSTRVLVTERGERTLPRSGTTRAALADHLGPEPTTMPRSGSTRAVGGLTRTSSRATSSVSAASTQDSAMSESSLTRTASMASMTRPRTSLAPPTPRQRDSVSALAPSSYSRHSLAPTAGPTPARRSLAPGGAGKVSSRQSLAPRTSIAPAVRPLVDSGDAAANAPGTSGTRRASPSSGVALARTKLSSSPPPDAEPAGPPRRLPVGAVPRARGVGGVGLGTGMGIAGPTAAVGSSAARLEAAKARHVGAPRVGVEVRESAVAQARIAAHRTGSAGGGQLAGIRARMSQVELGRRYE